MDKESKNINIYYTAYEELELNSKNHPGISYEFVVINHGIDEQEIYDIVNNKYPKFRDIDNPLGNIIKRHLYTEKELYK